MTISVPRKALVALTLAATLALPAAAQTAADIATVTGLAQDLERITEQGDIAAALKALPPTLLDANAQAQGLSRAEFDAMMTEGMAEMAAISKVRTSTIGAADMTWQGLPDGRLIALMPTRNLVEITLDPAEPPMLIEEDSTTIALKDQGVWRVVRAGSASQQELLRRAFPWLKGVPLPDATTRVIDQ